MFVGLKKNLSLQVFFVKPGHRSSTAEPFPAFISSFSLPLLFLHFHCKKEHLETQSAFGDGKSRAVSVECHVAKYRFTSARNRDV